MLSGIIEIMKGSKIIEVNSGAIADRAWSFRNLGASILCAVSWHRSQLSNRKLKADVYANSTPSVLRRAGPLTLNLSGLF